MRAPLKSIHRQALVMGAMVLSLATAAVFIPWGGSMGVIFTFLLYAGAGGSALFHGGYERLRETLGGWWVIAFWGWPVVVAGLRSNRW